MKEILKTSVILFLLSLLMACNASAQASIKKGHGNTPGTAVSKTNENENPAALKGARTLASKDWFFVENKGQLTDPNETGKNQTATADITYYVHNGGANLYCRPGVLSFVFTRSENDAKISEATATTNNPSAISPNGGDRGWKDEIKSGISISRMDLVFIGANKNAKVTAREQQSYYENYYTTGDNNHGITNVHTYKKLVYTNIYPNIDMLLTVGQGHGLEYAFMVHPGGRVSDIKMTWKGADLQKDMQGDGGQDSREYSHRYSCQWGIIEESAPRCFAGGKEIKSRFTRNGDVNGFKTEAYDKTRDLLIDPGLWATYYGGSGTDQGSGVSIDGSGNIYITGHTTSSSGIAKGSTYQTTYGTNTDVFLAQFSSTGTLNWATYYGGSGDDEGGKIYPDGSGNIYVTGYTASSSGIAKGNTYQTTYGTNTDAFLAQFSNTGALNWATYYGGTGSEFGIGICADGSGNIYIAGYTNSSSGIAKGSTYQTTIGGGQDAFLAQFSNAGALNWATYYGGSGTDLAAGVCSDGSGNIYITGQTTSSSSIAKGSTYQTSYGGSTDAFLAQFSNTGALNWATYYGGSSTDVAEAITADGSGNIYISGYTNGSSGIAYGSTYQTTYGGGAYDAFLAQFSNAGALNWATYYGGSGSDFSYGLCADGSGHIYVTDVTSSTSNIAKGSTYQTANGGGNDAFLAQFSNAGALNWATYFGGSGNDVSYWVCADGSGNSYITGFTNSSSSIASSGAYQSTFGGGSYDVILAKFNSVGALPVTLIGFGAELQNNHVNLTWQTASETNNDYFGIERSLDGIAWQTIGQVPGHGNSQVMENYAFTDNLQGIVPQGVIYYRLRQVDYNGNFEYSEIRAVNIESNPFSLQIYPNPVGNILNLNWTNADNGHVILKLINTTGATLFTENVSGQGLRSDKIDLSNFASGTYFLQIVGDKDVISKIVYKE